MTQIQNKLNINEQLDLTGFANPEDLALLGG
jgi:hypothetical protein